MRFVQYRPIILCGESTAGPRKGMLFERRTPRACFATLPAIPQLTSSTARTQKGVVFERRRCFECHATNVDQLFGILIRCNDAVPRPKFPIKIIKTIKIFTTIIKYQYFDQIDRLLLIKRTLKRGFLTSCKVITANRHLYSHRHNNQTRREVSGWPSTRNPILA
jgi:hypothetical protein